MINEAESTKYLGETIGQVNIDKNIEERYNKGIGSVNQIVSLLSEGMFRQNYFRTAIIFRNSFLINSMMFSSEALYGMKKLNLDKLNSCDTYLWKNLFGAEKCCPIISYYIESGCAPPHIILVGRRLMFHWSILQRTDTEVVRQVYIIQKKLPIKNDWVHQISSDLEKCQIYLSDQEIKSFTKISYKKIVLEKINFLTDCWIEEKMGTKSSQLGERGLKDYLISPEISLREKRLLYALRTYTTNLKYNRKSSYTTNLDCSLCYTHIEDQESLLLCPTLLSDVRLSSIIKTIKYSDIFGTLSEQTRAVRVWSKVIEVFEDIQLRRQQP